MTLHIGDHLVELHLIPITIVVLLSSAPIILSIIATIRIIQRAGYSGWWILVTFVPILNVLAFWYFAFGPWPSIDPKAIRSHSN
jgi:hypothetical protein